MSEPVLPKRKYKEVWQGGIILGTIWLGFGIVYTIQSDVTFPQFNIILFIAMGISYIISFIAFRKYNSSWSDNVHSKGLRT